MTDLTLPMKGGWILCTKVPPTAIKPTLFGVYYARPEKVFERGSFQIGSFGWSSGLTHSELAALYKHRANAKMSESERATLNGAIGRIETGRRMVDMEPPSLWEPVEDEESAAVPEAPLPVLEDIELEMRVRILTPDGEICLEPYEYSIISDIQPYLEEIGDGMIMHELGGVKNAKKLKDQMFYVQSRGIPKVEAFKMLLGQIDRWNVFWLETHPDIVAYFSR